VVLSLVIVFLFFRETHTPRFAHSAPLRVEGFLCKLCTGGAPHGDPIYFHIGYISLRDERPLNEVK